MSTPLESRALHVTPVMSQETPPLRWAARGFAYTSVTPILLIAAALALAAGLDRQWRLLTLIGAVVPVALLAEWALTTNRAALRGVPIRPAAHLTAIAVLVVGVLVSTTGVLLTATSPALFAGITALLSGGAR